MADTVMVELTRDELVELIQIIDEQRLPTNLKLGRGRVEKLIEIKDKLEAARAGGGPPV